MDTSLINVELIKNDALVYAKGELKDKIIEELMRRFDEQIVVIEQTCPDDPSKPSLFREEFKSHLIDTFDKSVTVDGLSINFGVGSESVLGVGIELDKHNTKGLNIIGTILDGIVGDYVLITREDLVGLIHGEEIGRLGRTGEAALMTMEKYAEMQTQYNWPHKEKWCFSSFKGLPDFFKIDLSKYMGPFLEELNTKIKKGVYYNAKST